MTQGSVGKLLLSFDSGLTYTDSVFLKHNFLLYCTEIFKMYTSEKRFLKSKPEW